MFKAPADSSRRARQVRQRARSRRLFLESLEERRVMAVTDLAIVAAPAVNEGQPLVLSLQFTDPALLTGSYTALVDWNDGSPRESVTLSPVVENAGTGRMSAQVSRTYSDDNPTATPTDPRTVSVAVFAVADPVTSYWPFDVIDAGTTPDVLGPNTGTLGTAVIASPIAAVGAGALRFPQDAQAFVSVGNGLTANTGLGVEALIRPDFLGGFQEIMRKEDGDNRFLLSFQSDPGPVLAFGTNIGGIYSELDLALDAPTVATLLDGAYHHIVGTYDEASGTRSLYIDGALRASNFFAAGSQVTLGGPVIAAIGNAAPGGNEPFIGSLDEVVYYDRAVTAAEVTDHYNRFLLGKSYFFESVTTAINNVAPQFDLGADANLAEGSAFNLAGSFIDPGTGSDTFTATVDYGDGAGPQPLTLVGNSFTLNNVYPNDGAFVVTVVISDDDTGVTSDSLTLNVQNVAPQFELGTDVAALAEGSTFNLAGSFTDPGADTWTATVDYGDGSGVQPLTLNADKSFALSHLYANDGAFLVTVRISDDDTFTEDTLTVNVQNVAPLFELGPDVGLIEGGTFNLAGSFTDPGADTWTATVDYGDGAGPQPLMLNADKTFALSRQYPGDGAFLVTVRINDDDTFTEDTLTVTVANSAPQFDLGPDVLALDENGVFNRAGSFTDPGNDTFSATVNYGTGAGVQPLTLNADNTFTLNNQYLDEGTFTVTVVISDDDGSVTDTLLVNVQNVAPVLVPAAPTIAEDSATVFILATFTDPGTLDIHTVTSINWGDGSTTNTTTVNQATNTITGSHVYSTPGTYLATLTINDGDGGIDTAQITIEVLNVPPIVVIDGPTTTVCNQPTTFTFSTDDAVTDPDAAITYEIDWDGDGDIDQVIDGTAAGIEVVHVFPLVDDMNSILVTATDALGDTGPEAELVIEVVVFALVPNDEGGEDVVVGGTHFADRIVLSLLFNGGVQARINSQFFRLPDSTGKIIVYGGEGGDNITVSKSLGYNFELYGGDGNDYIVGGRFDDILDGGAGNDRLLDNSGDNTFFGGDGNDTISGGSGNDTAFGGAGRDTLVGAIGNDILDGGEDSDTINGLDGDDILLGGPGNDVIRGERGHDILDGQAGNDRLTGGTGRDVLIGGLHSDQIYGGSDDDILIHGAVDHMLIEPDPDDPDAETLFKQEIAALMAILNDWLEPISIEDRIDLLSDRLNESTIIDDLVRDTLFGEHDRDWFLTTLNNAPRDFRLDDIRTDV